MIVIVAVAIHSSDEEKVKIQEIAKNKAKENVKLDDANDMTGSTSSSQNLVPPNPVERQPPSSSKLHFFKEGAVCSDSEICSIVGR